MYYNHYVENGHTYFLVMIIELQPFQIAHHFYRNPSAKIQLFNVVINLNSVPIQYSLKFPVQPLYIGKCSVVVSILWFLT